ncbi:hypothetical protein GCM10009836_20380 [Pseudonocardia ailaonensis]|uniref:TIR domain-containing protein n=1 Tax=Pseudonocardia ailaonensis TaxID=367279 RepID=A0ABN2MX54_9PSEU
MSQERPAGSDGPVRIFLSYRREDTQHAAARLGDRLRATFGADSVFMDVESIEPGLDFVDVVQSALASSTVCLAMIGTRWDGTRVDDTRRIDDEDDLVRIEVNQALASGLRVIPVLLDGARMPRASTLPQNIRSLSRRNGMTLDHVSFPKDSESIVTAIRKASSKAPAVPKASDLIFENAALAAKRAGAPGSSYLPLHPRRSSLSQRRGQGPIFLSVCRRPADARAAIRPLTGRTRLSETRTRSKEGSVATNRASGKAERSKRTTKPGHGSTSDRYGLRRAAPHTCPQSSQHAGMIYQRVQP